MRALFDPPLSPRFAWLEQTLQLRTGTDGYPERIRHGRWIAHPMDGRYLLDDYLDQYERAPSANLRMAITRVADAVVSRLQAFESSLVFWYEPEVVVRRANGRRTYSALTQAYYARTLARASQALGRRDYGQIADLCFAAIPIPQSRGGVLYGTKEDIALAQVPSRPRDLVLNGWLSALVAIDGYAELRGSHEARSLVVESARYAGHLLPLFDIPALCNTRYALTGVLRVEVRFDGLARIRISGASVHIPTEGTFPMVLGERGYWESHFWPSTVLGQDWPVEPARRRARANLVVSVASSPEPNTFVLAVESDSPVEASLYAHLGEYDPARATPSRRSWREIGRRALHAGCQEVAFEIPQQVIGAVAHPTNFGKEIGRDRVNSYHPTHVRRLKQLHERTGIEQLGVWGDRWGAYMRRWPELPMYRDRSVLLDGRVVPVAALAKGAG